MSLSATLLANTLSLTGRSSAAVHQQQHQHQQQQQQSQQPNVDDPISSNNNCSTTSLVNKHDSKMLVDQMSCAICLDIQVHPQTIVPCGHTYCGSCLAEIENDLCPECRSSMTSRVPALQLKGLIETLVQVPNMLDPSDIKNYQERKKTDRCRGYQVQLLHDIE
jgi:hypothetical protein